MNSKIVFGVARHLLTIGAGVLVTRGVIGENDVETIVSAVLALASVGWSIWENSKK